MSKMLIMLVLAGVLTTGPNHAQSQADREAQSGTEFYYSMERSFLAGDPHMPKAILAYNRCFIPKAQYGQFSSYDGGQSALRLYKACLDEGLAVINECETTAGHHSDAAPSELCATMPGFLVQAALKLLNK